MRRQLAFLAPEKSAGQPGHYKILEDNGADYLVFGDLITDFSGIVYRDFITDLPDITDISDWLLLLDFSDYATVLITPGECSAPATPPLRP